MAPPVRPYCSPCRSVSASRISGRMSANFCVLNCLSSKSLPHTESWLTVSLTTRNTLHWIYFKIQVFAFNDMHLIFPSVWKMTAVLLYIVQNILVTFSKVSALANEWQRNRTTVMILCMSHLLYFTHAFVLLGLCNDKVNVIVSVITCKSQTLLIHQTHLNDR